MPERSFGTALLIAIFPLAFIAAGTFVILATLREWSVVQASRSWPATTAFIEASDIVPGRDQDDPDMAIVRFRYVANGRQYRSNIVRHHALFGTNLKKFRARYAAGTSVPAWFDPDDPAHILLERSLQNGRIGAAVGGVLFIAIGLLIFRYLWRNRKSIY
jgi:hypothetical protein